MSRIAESFRGELTDSGIDYDNNDRRSRMTRYGVYAAGLALNASLLAGSVFGVFKLQDKMSEEIVDEVRQQLTEQTLEEQVNADGYELEDGVVSMESSAGTINVSLGNCAIGDVQIEFSGDQQSGIIEDVTSYNPDLNPLKDIC